jgi:hypothetical protein
MLDKYEQEDNQNLQALLELAEQKRIQAVFFAHLGARI